MGLFERQSAVYQLLSWASLLSVNQFCVHWAMLECFLRLWPISLLDIVIESSLDQLSIIVRFSADCLL